MEAGWPEFMHLRTHLLSDDAAFTSTLNASLEERSTTVYSEKEKIFLTAWMYEHPSVVVYSPSIFAHQRRHISQCRLFKHFSYSIDSSVDRLFEDTDTKQPIKHI